MVESSQPLHNLKCSTLKADTIQYISIAFEKEPFAGVVAVIVLLIKTYSKTTKEAAIILL